MSLLNIKWKNFNPDDLTGLSLIVFKDKKGNIGQGIIPQVFSFKIEKIYSNLEDVYENGVIPLLEIEKYVPMGEFVEAGIMALKNRSL